MIASQFALVVKNSILITTLLLSTGVCFPAEATIPPGNSVSVKFVVDGKPLRCEDLTIHLSMGKMHIIPTRIPDGFLVPTAFFHAYASDQLRRKDDVAVTVKCDEYTIAFSGLYPARVLPGSWEVGISYPTSWFDSPAGAPETGTWLSYLETDCNGCDPGVVVWQSHPVPPEAIVARLREEQPKDDGQRARDVAYALAVFNTDYETNRNTLVNTLQECVSRPRNSPEDDVCDRRLVQYLADLYWRGDNELLGTLLGIADRREDVVDEAGSFYADLLSSRTAIALDGIRTLPAEKQSEICAMAFKDDLSSDPPKLKQTQTRLRQTADDVAQRCLEELKDPKPQR